MTCCYVLGCTKTTQQKLDEWVCPRHWQLVSRPLRHRYNATRKLVEERPTSDLLVRAHRKWWRRCREQAMHAHLGLV